MKSTKEQIDALQEYGKGLPTSSVTHSAKRAKSLGHLQRFAEYLWNVRGWPFKNVTEDVTITNGVGSLPTNFSAVGEEGGVYLGVGFPPLKWIPFAEWKKAKQLIGSTGTPNCYSVGWMGQIGDADAGRRQLCVYPLAVSETVHLWYERTCPVLVDEAVVATDEMGEWPPSFETIIYEGALWYHYKSIGSAQTNEQASLVRELLRGLYRSERPGREAPHRIVAYRGRR